MKRTKRNTSLTMLLAAITLSVVGLVLFACTSDDPSTSSPTPDSEIRLNADVWRMMEGTRATTFYNSATDLQTEGFICYAYPPSDYIHPYIEDARVVWDGTNSEWVFSGGKRYWPAEGNLDFFAFWPLPGSLNYMSAYWDCNSTNGPTITCENLSNSASDYESTEFVYAYNTNQNKYSNDGNGVALVFWHPFARIKFAWAGGSAPASLSAISIKLKNIYNNGTFYHKRNPKWEVSGDRVDFEVGSMGYIGDGEWHLVVPQSWEGAIEVEATWDDWGAQITHYLTTSVPTNWQPGYSYTYTFTITTTDLIVNTEKYTEQW